VELHINFHQNKGKELEFIIYILNDGIMLIFWKFYQYTNYKVYTLGKMNMSCTEHKKRLIVKFKAAESQQ
jgi:hypothetical protein